MENNRAKALVWWRQLTPSQQQEVVKKHFPDSFFEFVASSSSKIEQMFNIENRSYE